MIEVQGSKIAGGLFGYSTDGAPEWQLFGGDLEFHTSEGSAVWRAQAAIQRFRRGGCLECAYSPPATEIVGELELEFRSSNAARYRVISAAAASAWKPLFSITFGSAVSSPPRDLAGLYRAPVPDGSWVFVFHQLQPLQGRQPASRTYQLDCSTSARELPNCVVSEAYPAEFLIVGQLTCEAGGGSSVPTCRISGLDFEPSHYIIAWEDIGDARISGLSLDGKTKLQGFRLNYD